MGVAVVMVVAVAVVLGIGGVVIGLLSLLSGTGPASLRITYVALMSAAVLAAIEAKDVKTGLGVIAAFGFFYAAAAFVAGLLGMMQIGSENGFVLRGRRR